MIDEMINASLVEPKMNATKHEFYKRFCDKAGVCIYVPAAVHATPNTKWRKLAVPHVGKVD